MESRPLPSPSPVCDMVGDALTSLAKGGLAFLTNALFDAGPVDAAYAQSLPTLDTYGQR